MLTGLMLDQIQTLTEKTNELEKKIAALLKELDSTITSIPGIGPVLGATIISEIGDAARFRSADKLAAYIGGDPSINQSGEFTVRHVHISKRGSPYFSGPLWKLRTYIHEPKCPPGEALSSGEGNLTQAYWCTSRKIDEAWRGKSVWMALRAGVESL